MEMLVGFNGCGVVAIFPERSLTILSLVVFLRRSAGDELHALRDNILAGILHQEVDVIGCHNVVEHAQSEALLSFEDLVTDSGAGPARTLKEIAFDGSGA